MTQLPDIDEFIGSTITEGEFKDAFTSFYNYVKEINTTVENFGSTPVGTILPYIGSSVPEDYLICDGSELNTSAYPELYSVIGTTYGGGDGTFNLPDLKDKFLQCNGTNSIGTSISPGLPEIYGAATPTSKYDVTVQANFTGCLVKMSSGQYGASESDYQTGVTPGFYIYASEYNDIYSSSDTVQPNSFVCNFIIKY